MSNKPIVQKSKEIFKQQQNLRSEEKPHGGVRQDKIAPGRDREASGQPAPRKKVFRSQPSNNKTTRTKSGDVLKRRTVELSLWVKPGVKEELVQLAKRKGISVSATGAALLERILQDEIDRNTGTLLEPIIRQAIRREMRSLTSRIFQFLVQITFGVEQIRSLCTNILVRLPGSGPTGIDGILDKSAQSARRKVTTPSLQLKALLTEMNGKVPESDEQEKDKG